MGIAVKLTVITGPHHRDRYCIREKASCLIGRAPDCPVQLSGHQQDLLISRHHCRLDFDPPRIYIQDLHSTNGTFLNGNEILPDVTVREGEPEPQGIELQDSDILTVGGTTMQVHLIDCRGTGCSSSAQENTESQDTVPGTSERELTSLPVCQGECLQANGYQTFSDGLVVAWKTPS